MPWRWSLIGLVLLGGCVNYRHAIVAPPELARDISDEQPDRIDHDGLVYLFQTNDNYLVMQVGNPAGGPMLQLAGEESWLVTPDGRSLPLASQAIAPGAHLELVLPPPPRRARHGPRLGVGIGMGTIFGGGPYVGSGVGVGTTTESSYLDPPWDWPPAHEIRLRLALKHGDATLTHDWTLRRDKKK